MTERQVCLDMLRGERCALDQGHPGSDPSIHIAASGHQWGARDVPVPAWRAEAERALRERGRVAVREIRSWG